MKNRIYTSIFGGALLLLSACGSEAPFGPDSDQFGKLNAEALNVDYANSSRTTKGAADETAPSPIDIKAFSVEITKSGESTPEKTFAYGEMPGIIVLPTGTYTATASYGENPECGWNCPYYTGTTGTPFEITANKITDSIDPIVCKLSNVKVEVRIATGEGVEVSDARVVVNAREGAELTFTDRTRASGYFRYAEGNTTLAATFSALIGGVEISREFAAFTAVAAGNYYKLTFTVAESPTNTEPGTITIGDEHFTVKGTVTTKDENIDIDPGDTDEGLTDDLRPKYNS